MPPITKFTYLCELLDPKVKHIVDSLPFTAEGYNRAKSVLQDHFGKESEIIKLFVKNILDSPYILSTNPKKIRDFSERLNHSVQALQTMNKLSQVDGNIAMNVIAISNVIARLPAICGDLARTDADSKKWTFAQLCKPVRQWTKRNPVDQNRLNKEKERNSKVL